ncbi:uncharacterized protein MONBRDRAFT_24391 [Monosiga brevicollis MX1]|uniref:Uncharacterized protein n=1 Tax=Monosiga brevicollis TaxID=81824 RepID=A9UW99_MONBE|nr:uncharacterized protein MONBRDRAFT_24391 [Monosiga brevicollis MX1]EDQ90528.1 predicted protein [Monosiga brevicollis MX1]|eukprot:XP_001744579.1 hypothetical protein [Monosiga brevicollis MX1]
MAAPVTTATLPLMDTTPTAIVTSNNLGPGWTDNLLPNDVIAGITIGTIFGLMVLIVLAILYRYRAWPFGPACQGSRQPRPRQTSARDHLLAAEPSQSRIRAVSDTHSAPSRSRGVTQTSTLSNPGQSPSRSAHRHTSAPARPGDPQAAQAKAFDLESLV